MKARAQELKAEARTTRDKAAGEADVLARIDELPAPERAMARRLHFHESGEPRLRAEGPLIPAGASSGNIVPTGFPTTTPSKEHGMELGAFSVSLAVKDLAASRSFYEKFGFAVFHGDASQNWLIMKNGDCVIGLFQGMFDKNILTFNPGWDRNAQSLASFTDVRELQRQLKARGVELVQEADESTTGPAAFVAVDPDGNPILVDQHV